MTTLGSSGVMEHCACNLVVVMWVYSAINEFFVFVRAVLWEDYCIFNAEWNRHASVRCVGNH